MAQSVLSSPNSKKLTVPGHSLKLGCQKISRRCEAKRISKSKRQKSDVEEWHAAVARGTSSSQNEQRACILEVSMSQRCPTEEVHRLILSWSINPSVT